MCTPAKCIEIQISTMSKTNFVTSLYVCRLRTILGVVLKEPCSVSPQIPAAWEGREKDKV